MRAVPPGRLALAATDPFTYADAVADLLDLRAAERRDYAYHPHDGWPWPDSTHTDWTCRFRHGHVEITIAHPVVHSARGVTLNAFAITFEDRITPSAN